MKPAPPREVYHHIKDRIERIRKAYSHVTLNSHDWDDITQIIMIHIARKWPMWNGGLWKGWVNKIIHNQIQNQFRARILDVKKRGEHHPLYTKVQETENGDQEVVVWERDVEDDGPDMLTHIYRAIDRLPAKDMKLFDTMLNKGSWEAARGKMNSNGFQAYRKKQCGVVRKMVEEMICD